MKLKEAIKQYKGFAFVVQDLDLQTSVAKRCLGDLPWLSDEKKIEAENNRLKEVFGAFETQYSLYEILRRKFSQSRDIVHTLDLLKSEILDEVQLFEIKYFALLCEQISPLVDQLGFSRMPCWKDVKEAVDVLDPNKERLPAFYIYDAYDSVLTQKRKSLQSLMDAEGDATVLRDECKRIEDRICQELTEKLRIHQDSLLENLSCLAYWDITLAKVLQAKQRSFCIANLACDGIIRLQGLFYPRVKNILEEKGEHYQSVDIFLASGACLLTGANMSGKTILLKSITTAQLLFQYGFFVPAEEASLPLFDQVRLLAEDGQSEQKGLSSFAHEIMRLNEVWELLKKGKNILLMVDELARTTNPVEGSAMVEAVLEGLSSYRCTALISTHYSDVRTDVRRLRIKGLRTDVKWDVKNIQKCMDYAVMETDAKDSPSEALNIAKILSLEEDLWKLAKEKYEQKCNNQN